MHTYRERKVPFSGLRIVVPVLLTLLLFSCRSNKSISYFNNIPDTLNSPYVVKHSEFIESKIRSNDLLYINIATIESQGNSMLEASSAINPLDIDRDAVQVDKNGYIELPIVGKVEVAGLTTTEAKEVVREKATRFYKDPIVNIRFANFNITVLGEVKSPGTYKIVNEKVNVIEAIGLAGDLTPQGKRENVLLIREEEGNKFFVRYNLESSELFTSPYYYLKQGDILYVEPNKSKTKAATTDYSRDRIFTYTVSALTLLVAIFSRIQF